MSYSMKLFQDELARCIQRLHSEGWLPNESMGEASVRDSGTGNVTISIKPDTIGVTDPAAYLGSDMPVVDSDGNYITHHAPCHENLPLHLAIYKARSDVSAIIHVYPLWTTMFTNRKQGLPFVLAEQAEASCNVGCVQSDPAATEAYYREVVETLPDQKCVMLYNGGIICVGDNIDNVINYVAWMESVAEKIALAELIGEVETITDQPLNLVTANYEYTVDTDYNTYQNYNEILFKEEVARGTRMLNIKGYSPSGESGDVAVRDLQTGLCYISGSPAWCFQKNLRDARGWERFICDKDDHIFTPYSEPTCEWVMHTAIFRKRPDVGAIVQTHGRWATVFAILEMDVPLDLIGEGLTGVIPCTPYRSAGTNDLGEVIADGLKDSDYVLMGHHGAVIVGKTMDEAMAKTAWMEKACEKAFYAILCAGGAKASLAKARETLGKTK